MPGCTSGASRGTIRVDERYSNPVRITFDPSAPVTYLPDDDKTHPHCMTELLKVLAGRISDIGVRVIPPRVRTVFDAHGLQSNVGYTWKPKYGTRRYTNEFVDWLKERIRKDDRFIVKTRYRLRREGPFPALRSQ